MFALAWRMAFPPGVQSRFWITLSALAQQTLTVDELDEFLGIYKRLGLALGGYLARNLAVLLVGGAALVASLMLALSPLQRAWDASHGAASPGSRVAICASGSSCWLPALLGFEIRETAQGPKSPVVVRANDGDINPAYPWLSDLEASFLALFLLAMTVGMLWPHKKGAGGPEPILKQSDFALVQINEQLKPLVRMAGNLETRLYRARLAERVEAPVFVCGLARSGTTTVLNALTRSREVASHQYRDFPFVAAPLTWARLQGALSKEAAPVERPHKDRILISKTSADAFEEPLWQSFFPFVHDPGRSQRLDASVSHPKFEAFYEEHLRKILHLRGAPRYVSKGNYNVGRIEYLAKLFPDARFVVPVRAPVEHVASLVRQHELFVSYAAVDPRVPLYLAAAGHYEFGPQRRAIVYSKDGVGPAKAAAAAGDDVLIYALQWAEVYGHVARLMASPLANRILLVPYERFCAEPERWLADILAQTGLKDPDGAIAAFARSISVSEAPVPAAVAARREEIEAVARVAGEFDLGQRKPQRRKAAEA